MGSFQFTLNSVEIDGRNVIESMVLLPEGKCNRLLTASVYD